MTSCPAQGAMHLLFRQQLSDVKQMDQRSSTCASVRGSFSSAHSAIARENKCSAVYYFLPVWPASYLHPTREARASASMDGLNLFHAVR
jgi:hypothetical protein